MPIYPNDNEEEEIKATKIFTDREEPRKAFWNKYEIMKNNMEAQIISPISVISYYGFGGIGKSSLLLKLKEEIENKPISKNSKIQFIDFNKIEDFHNDILEILRYLEQELKRKYNFRFPIFDLVVYKYEMKMGRNVTKNELCTIFDEYKELNYFKDVISEIPLVGIFAKIIYYADKGRVLFKERLNNKKLKSRLSEIENMDNDLLKARLSYFFAVDLKENLKDEKEPFVFLIDTYEKLTNELNEVGNALNEDEWLRGKDGLICNLSNVIWVIAGREKLKWQEFDKNWEGSLEQHLLGVISFTDAKYFLEVAGIKDQEMIKQIYSLSKGTPMYLDMCVDTYIKLLEDNKIPTLEDFKVTQKKLVERFFMYMSNTEKDFITMLAYIGEWSDNTIENITRDLIGNFSFNFYNKIKKFSFIVNENNKYKIHDAIREILISESSELEKEKYMVYVHSKIDRAIEQLSIEQKGKSEIGNLYKEKIQYKKLISEIIYDLNYLDLDENVNNQKEFCSKVSFLIDKIVDFENKFNENFDKDKLTRIIDKFGKVKKFTDTAEFIKLESMESVHIYPAYNGYHNLLRIVENKEEASFPVEYCIKNINLLYRFTLLDDLRIDEYYPEYENISIAEFFEMYKDQEQAADLYMQQSMLHSFYCYVNKANNVHYLKALFIGLNIIEFIDELENTVPTQIDNMYIEILLAAIYIFSGRNFCMTKKYKDIEEILIQNDKDFINLRDWEKKSRIQKYYVEEKVEQIIKCISNNLALLNCKFFEQFFEYKMVGEITHVNTYYAGERIEDFILSQHDELLKYNNINIINSYLKFIENITNKKDIRVKNALKDIFYLFCDFYGEDSEEAEHVKEMILDEKK